jgi:hypothetical protein
VTGWNQRQPPITAFNRLAGLTGSYVPFAWTKVQQRYGSKEAYLEKVRASAEALVKARFLLPEAVQACVDRAAREWDWRAAAISVEATPLQQQSLYPMRMHHAIARVTTRTR